MPRFITIEGIEGVGKSTAVSYLKSLLDAAQIAYTHTREPGGTPMAEAIRGVLLAHYEEPVTPMTEVLMMFAGRSQHVENCIKPALASGQWVISDRFTDASFAYQSAGRGVDETILSSLARWVHPTVNPDLTILLDAPVALAMERVTRRGKQADRFEVEAHTFFERIKAGYLKRAAAEPERFVIVDASQSLEGVQAQLRLIFEQLTAT